MLCFSNTSVFFVLSTLDFHGAECVLLPVLGALNDLSQPRNFDSHLDRSENVYGGHFASTLCTTSKTAIADRYTEISR